MRNLEGRVFLVTGASSGLGRAIALKAAAKGAKLALCGRSAAKLAALSAELGLAPTHTEVRGGGVFLEAFDLLDPGKPEIFVGRALSRFGKIDVLVNCAGANTARSPLETMALADLDTMFRLNCLAPAALMRACHPAMAAAGGGLVINILSTCCHFANEDLGAYTASKTALEGLTKVYRKEARKANIRVCAVYPGGINTAFRPQPRPEYLTAEDVADAILTLAAMDIGVAPDELVLRPLVEANYP
jgi:NAD(P)-dependent dehydrogenase (short-subunit alcohol dehydrogenase family)